VAVTATQLTTNSSTTNGTSFTTASVTPGANRLVTLLVYAAVASGTTGTISASGAGLTFTQEVQTTTALRTMFLLRAMSASPSSGALTITSSVTLGNCLWQVVHFDGVDTSGTNGSGAITQSHQTSPASASSVNVAFPTTVTAGNATYAGVGLSGSTELPTAGTAQGWSSLGTTSQTQPSSSLLGEFAGTAAQNITASWTTAAASFVAGIEIQAAGAGGGAGPVPTRVMVSNPAVGRASTW
jgi:hypothetical protein